ncbi:hypothetical protein PV328_012451, partial [Microctonus aethiopoides]
MENIGAATIFTYWVRNQMPSTLRENLKKLELLQKEYSEIKLKNFSISDWIDAVYAASEINIELINFENLCNNKYIQATAVQATALKLSSPQIWKNEYFNNFNFLKCIVNTDISEYIPWNNGRLKTFLKKKSIPPKMQPSKILPTLIKMIDEKQNIECKEEKKKIKNKVVKKNDKYESD